MLKFRPNTDPIKITNGIDSYIDNNNNSFFQRAHKVERQTTDLILTGRVTLDQPQNSK